MTDKIIVYRIGGSYEDAVKSVVSEAGLTWKIVRVRTQRRGLTLIRRFTIVKKRHGKNGKEVL